MEASEKIQRLIGTSAETVETLSRQKDWNPAVEACRAVLGDEDELFKRLLATPALEQGRAIQKDIEKVCLSQSSRGRGGLLSSRCARLPVARRWSG